VNVNVEEMEGVTGFVPNDDEYSPRIVTNLSFDYFRKKLVENVSIRYNNNDVIWPQRAKRKDSQVESVQHYNLYNNIIYINIMLYIIIIEP
jgi:hypothetical protein